MEKKLFLLIILFSFTTFLFAESVRRHIIVAVDCSGSFQKAELENNRDSLKSDLLSLLKSGRLGNSQIKFLSLENEARGDIKFFDPSTDELSLFMFGMPGKERASIIDRYGRTKSVDNEHAFMREFSHSFIFRHANYGIRSKMDSPDVGPGMYGIVDFDEFSENWIYPMFGDCDIIDYYRRNSSKESGTKTSAITLSHYVYPLIWYVLHTFDYANEYIMLVLSDYETGNSEGDGADRREVSYILSQPAMNSFQKQVDILSQSFYRVDYFQDVRGKLMMKAYKIRPRIGLGTDDARLVIESDLNLKQTTWHSEVFKTDVPVMLRFDHTELFTPQQLNLVVYDDENQLLFEDELAHINNSGKMVDKDNHDIIKGNNYVLRDLEVVLNGVTSSSDFQSLSFRMQMLGTYKVGDTEVPLTYEAKRTILPNNINFKNPVILIIIMYLIIIALIIVLLIWLYVIIVRGKRKTLTIELEHSDADEGTYQHVSRERGAVLLPCDFPKKGVTKIIYTLQGHITKDGGMSVSWPVSRVFVKPSLTDAPVGMTVKVRDAENNGWMYVFVKKNHDFSVDLEVDFSRCKSDVKEVRVWLQWKFEPSFPLFGRNPFAQSGMPGVEDESSFADAYCTNVEGFNKFLENAHLMYGDGREVIHNFVRAPYEYPDYWVGIDPGTNGSCITIGTGQGSSADDPKIARVTALDGEGIEKSIINSLIVIGGSAAQPSGSVSQWQPTLHYDFGLNAYSHVKQYIDEGAYCYQSIKKLLGYKKGGRDGRLKAVIGSNTFEFSGLDLQMLLVRALIKQVMSNYVKRIEQDGMLVQIKNNIFPDGIVRSDIFKRAVVAIPNNYQLPQILDMVNSVKMNGFEEVKFIYEPEGILFHYLKQTYHSHKYNEKENIIVFDMGGATINATVFHVDIKVVNKEPSYHVRTLSRLGYAVGGDDIDYAIIEYLMHFKHISSLFENDAARYKWQDEHKTFLVNLAQEFKIAFVQLSDNRDTKGTKDAGTGSPVSLSTLDSFRSTYLKPIAKEIDLTKEDVSFTKEEGDCFSGLPFDSCIKNDLLNSVWMQEYVYNKVEDAVLDMMSTQDVKSVSLINKIVFSGRSTMFPIIKERVKAILKKNSRAPQEYALNGDLKSPVADGACWYGMFEGKIVFMDNSRVTSSYGFCYTRPGEEPYLELIEQNSRYENKNGTEISRRANVQSKFSSDAGHVNFYQVMGRRNHGVSIFDENNRHKVRFLNSINLAGSTAKTEIITVCANGKVICDVDYPGKPANQGPVTTEFDARDITKENARPYLFSVSDSEKHIVKHSDTVRSTVKSNSFRREEKAINSNVGRKF